MLRKSLLVAVASGALWIGQSVNSMADHCRGPRPYQSNYPHHHHHGYGGGYGSYRPIVPPPVFVNPYGGYTSYSSSTFGYGAPVWGSYGAGGFPRGGAYGMGGYGPGFSLYIGR